MLEREIRNKNNMQLLTIEISVTWTINDVKLQQWMKINNTNYVIMSLSVYCQLMRTLHYNLISFTPRKVYFLLLGCFWQEPQLLISSWKCSTCSVVFEKPYFLESIMEAAVRTVWVSASLSAKNKKRRRQWSQAIMPAGMVIVVSEILHSGRHYHIGVVVSLFWHQKHYA